MVSALTIYLAYTVGSLLFLGFAYKGFLKNLYVKAKSVDLITASNAKDIALASLVNAMYAAAGATTTYSFFAYSAMAVVSFVAMRIATKKLNSSG